MQGVYNSSLILLADIRRLIVHVVTAESSLLPATVQLIGGMIEGSPHAPEVAACLLYYKRCVNLQEIYYRFISLCCTKFAYISTIWYPDLLLSYGDI